MYLDEPREVEPGKVLKVYSELEAKEYVGVWVKSLLSKVKTREFLNQKKYFFMWEVLGDGNSNLIEKKQAQDEYDSHVAPKYVVFYRKPNNNIGDDELVAFTTDLKPDNLNGMDVCVTPANFSWSMFFTHEEEDYYIGPFFIKNKNYKLLNAQNIKNYKSLVAARDKGWI